MKNKKISIMMIVLYLFALVMITLLSFYYGKVMTGIIILVAGIISAFCMLVEIL